MALLPNGFTTVIDIPSDDGGAFSYTLEDVLTTDIIKLEQPAGETFSGWIPWTGQNDSTGIVKPPATMCTDDDGCVYGSSPGPTGYLNMFHVTTSGGTTRFWFPENIVYPTPGLARQQFGSRTITGYTSYVFSIEDPEWRDNSLGTGVSVKITVLRNNPANAIMFSCNT